MSIHYTCDGLVKPSPLYMTSSISRNDDNQTPPPRSDARYMCKGAAMQPRRIESSAAFYKLLAFKIRAALTFRESASRFACRISHPKENVVRVGL